VLSQSPSIARDERLNSLAGVVRAESEHLNNDIQNLLDATRITRDQIKARLEWIEPVDIVNSALERRRSRLSGHAILLDVDANLPFIYVDPVLIEQALAQIIDNAAKYSPPGSTITVSAKRNGQGLVLAVSDTGLGLTEDESVSQQIELPTHNAKGHGHAHDATTHFPPRNLPEQAMKGRCDGAIDRQEIEGVDGNRKD
jgi:two-component system, OmpR family, sensor histidine kinase KdpD